MEPLEWNPFDPAFRNDPYPSLRWLREHDPVHRIELRTACWLVTRYTDVVTAFRDRRLSAERFQLSAPELQSSALIRSLSSMMLLRDPPAHTRLRTLVSKAFTPPIVEALRPRIQEIADGLLDRLRNSEEIELMGDLAAPLPVVVIAQLLGVPAADREQFKRWSDDLIVIADGSLALDGLPRAEQSAAALKEYLGTIIEQRRRHPEDDLISGMVAAQEQEQGDVLSDGELFSTCVLLLIAGHETTTNLIGNGVLALLRHPDELARLRREPTLIATAVEELLRYESPVQLTSRVAQEDLEMGGKRIQAGEEVSLLLGAANRDPMRFTDPDQLDLARSDNTHVAFGYGMHFCLGAPLARIEGQVAIHSLLQRFADLRLMNDAPEWREGVMLRGLKQLPLRVQRPSRDARGLSPRP